MYSECRPSRSNTTLRHDPILFVSDIHVVPGNKERARQFTDFLEFARQQGIGSLMILGDLFDYWVGRGHEKQQEYRRVLDKLRDLSDTGIDVFLFHGNRDFFLGEREGELAGATIAGHDMDVQIGGKTVHLCHGDHLCRNDRGYQRFRLFLRSRFFFVAYHSCPFFVRNFLGRALRGVSKQTVAVKSKARVAMSSDAVNEIFENGADILICGHTHTQGESFVQHNGTEHVLYNLGEWSSNGSYLLYKDGEYTLTRWEE